MILTFRPFAYQGGSYMKTGGSYTQSFTGLVLSGDVPELHNYACHHLGASLYSPYAGPMVHPVNSPIHAEFES